MSSRRDALNGLRQPRSDTHAGLWLDRYIYDQSRDDPIQRRQLVREVAGLEVPRSYHLWFNRWQKSLTEGKAELREAEVLGRMSVGLGADSVLETSVTLHRTYSVPYIPGSALKGLAAAFARRHLGDDWQRDSRAFRTVFGDTDSAGYVTFFDALPIPGTRPFLYEDTITVHHPEYYQGKDKPPADWDSPTPIPFLSATGKYLIALAGPRDWVQATFGILGHALLNLGIGAKTSSGYGRMRLQSEPPPDPDQAAADQLIAEIQTVPIKQVAGGIQKFYQRWKDLQSGGTQKRRVAEAVVKKVREADCHKRFRGTPWYQELLSFVK